VARERPGGVEIARAASGCERAGSPTVGRDDGNELDGRGMIVGRLDPPVARGPGTVGPVDT